MIAPLSKDFGNTMFESDQRSTERFYSTLQACRGYTTFNE
jgi:hypothetical protein